MNGKKKGGAKDSRQSGRAQKKAEEVAAEFFNTGKYGIKSDVKGAYTGMSEGGFPPEQDADDI